MQAGSIVTDSYIGLCVLLEDTEIFDLASDRPLSILLSDLGVSVRGTVKIMCATPDVRKALRTTTLSPGNATLVYIVAAKSLRTIRMRPKIIRLTTSNQVQGKPVVLRIASADFTDLNALLRKGELDARAVSDSRSVTDDR